MGISTSTLLGGSDTPKGPSLTQFTSYNEFLERKRTLFEERLRKGSEVKQAKLEDFKIQGLLNKGTYSQVLDVKHKTTKQHYAMKVRDKASVAGAPRLLLRMQTERRLLAAIDFEFIIKLCYTCKDNANFFLILESAPCGDFQEYLSKKADIDISHEEGRFCVGQIVLAVEYLHEANIVHRDVKPENLLITGDGYLKLADFGFAKIMTSKYTNTLLGTIEFMAPEIFELRYGKPVDCWAMGCVAYQILYGNTPFWDCSNEQIQKNICSPEPFVFPDDSESREDPTGFPDFIARILDKQPRRRLGCDTERRMGEVKCHAWFQDAKFDWNTLYEKKYPTQLSGFTRVEPRENWRPLANSTTEQYVDEFKDF